MDEIKELLRQINICIKQYEIENEIRHSEYNLFNVLEVEELEVIMCRFLTDLLNPKGKHGCGELFLKSFLNSVCKIDCDISKTAVVQKEYKITDDRRIDIFIQNGNLFLPIEVKINAGEQEAQCFDYYEFSKQYGGITRLVYLTPLGTMPSDFSLNAKDGSGRSLNKEKIIPISFKYDIINWLLSLQNELQGDVRNAVLQYVEAIERFVDFEMEKLKMKAADVILQSEENFASALQIEKSVKPAKIKIMKNLFHEFDKQMKPIEEKYGLEKIKLTDDLVDAYYDKKSGECPGIYYLVKNAEFSDKSAKLCLEILIDWALFASFCVETDCSDVDAEMINAELKKYINTPNEFSKEYYIEWRYLPSGLGDKAFTSDVPDFWNCNSAMISLADENKMRELVKKSISVIENNLLSLLK